MENHFRPRTTLVAVFFQVLKLRAHLDFPPHPPLFASARHCCFLGPTVWSLFTDKSSSYYASRYSTVSLCQYKLKNAILLTFRVFDYSTCSLSTSTEQFKPCSLFYGTYFILSVVFQLKLAATSKRRLPKANPIQTKYSR